MCVNHRCVVGVAGAPEAGEVVWLRPQEIAGCNKPVLFKDGVEPGDVIQGAISDCWILSSLSMAATAPGLIENLFRRPKCFPDIGLYTLRFYKNGQWVNVIVDDRIPCYRDTGTPVFAQCKDGNETWVMLVEKAYAKLHGCYEALNGGEIDYGLRDISGMRACSDVLVRCSCVRWCAS